ncbi:hypothetical protein BDY19DRAFT_472692 [Irpex rosettiformis]|uniref:Uncharacterized protein n=1 Tax=Irpex rosettiformis TaxID=378272 RepID=A0ACB8TS61_9APHY|nr:hypothetical protein BDY19DRAFT_472692 [Irpex rosettiformis]
MPQLTFFPRSSFAVTGVAMSVQTYRGISDLPPELHSKIRDHLYHDIPDNFERAPAFGACSLVNRLWRSLFQPAVHETVFLSNGCEKIIELFVRSARKKRDPHGAPLYRYVKHLHIQPTLFWRNNKLYKDFIKTCGRNVTTLSLYWLCFSSQDAFKTFIGQFPSVTRLHLDGIRWTSLGSRLDRDRHILDVIRRRKRPDGPTSVTALTIRDSALQDESYKMAKRFVAHKNMDVFIRTELDRNDIARLNELHETIGMYLKTMTLHLHYGPTSGSNIVTLPISFVHNTRIEELSFIFSHRNSGATTSLIKQAVASLSTVESQVLHVLRLEFRILNSARKEDFDDADFEPLIYLVQSRKFPVLHQVFVTITLCGYKKVHDETKAAVMESILTKLQPIRQGSGHNVQTLDVQMRSGESTDGLADNKIGMSCIRMSYVA